MKILQISTVYPVKDLPDENPYVRNYINNYRYKYNDGFAVLKPESHLPKGFGILSDKPDLWLKKRKICKLGFYKEKQTSIFVLPYYSIGSISWTQTFFSSFIYNFNKKRIRELVKKHFDVVHAHYLFPDGLLAYQISKRFNKPFILTLRQEVRFFNNWYSRWWIRKIIDQATVLTTQSPQMAEVVNSFGIKKVRTLPTGIEDYFFTSNSQNNKAVILNAAKRNEESPANFRGDPSLSVRMTKIKMACSQVNKNEKLKLLSVCNLLPVKNLESVMEAISKMPEKHQIDYTIYGTGPSEDKLKSLVQQLGLEQTVHFKGTVKNKDLPALMPEFDVFIQPSFKETFGLSYFEAMACGLPVILTENTGAYEMIKNKDVYYLVDPLEPVTIMNCLQGILEDQITLTRKAATAPEVAKIASWGPFVDYFHEEVVKNISP